MLDWFEVAKDICNPQPPLDPPFDLPCPVCEDNGVVFSDSQERVDCGWCDGYGNLDEDGYVRAAAWLKDRRLVRDAKRMIEDRRTWWEK